MMDRIDLDRKPLKEIFLEDDDVDEKIERANQELQMLFSDYPVSSDEWEYYLWKYEYSGRSDKMKSFLIAAVLKQAFFLLGGGEIVEKLLAKVLKAIMDNTDIDDRAWDAVAEYVKETIPGDDFEPIMGEIMIQIGERLKSKEV